MAHIEVFKGWAETVRADSEAFKTLLESAKADDHSKKVAASALNYMVSRMDLIPDWNEGIGVIDDVMILRVSAQLTQNDERGELSSTAIAALERMAGEADKILQFLGAPLYDKLKAYCTKLVEQKVKGRTATDLVTNADARKALYSELEDELKKNAPIVINDPADAELRLKAYLTHKLQD